VGDPARQERERAGLGAVARAAALDLERAAEHVERLVLVVVDMQRRPVAGRRVGLDQAQVLSGRGGGGLDRHLCVGEPDPLALAGGHEGRADGRDLLESCHGAASSARAGAAAIPQGWDCPRRPRP
jgi:hypothetical protein